jgi:hypothetical protein
MVKTSPLIGDDGSVLMLVMVGATADTVSDTPPEVRPVLLFFTVTVNVPAVRVICPDIPVAVPFAFAAQAGAHAGPLNETVLFEASKPVPLSVNENAWFCKGGLGFVVMPLIAGAAEFAEIVTVLVPTKSPVPDAPVAFAVIVCCPTLNDPADI